MDKATALSPTLGLWITNTLVGKRVPFMPQDPNRVLFYSCGPTVYGPLHIGNARALYTADFMARTMRYLGYGVVFVRNYTDVDDKIIDRAAKEGISSEAVAEKYIALCETNMKQLGLGQPDHVVRVTESIPEILAMIQTLIERGMAYVVDGEVFYSIDRFPTYGKLSGKNIEELVAGARVEVQTKKKNPLDFSLWKPAKPGEPKWDSPWGQGRPGWHIECSAMAKRWLGTRIDLHHGGMDLIFPHHENEIAQSEGAHGETFCDHWAHNGFITVGKEKMSKSLGNIFEIGSFVEEYGAEVLKYSFAKHHYRSGFDLNDSALDEVLGELERIYSALQMARRIGGNHRGDSGISSPTAGELSSRSGLRETLDQFPRRFAKEMAHDFNAPGGLAVLFTVIREWNKTFANPDAITEGEKMELSCSLLNLVQNHVVPVMNIGGEDPDRMLKLVNDIRLRRSVKPSSGSQDQSFSEDAVLQAIEERKQARAQRDFAKADEIRRRWESMGIVFVDTPQGTTWKAKG